MRDICARAGVNLAAVNYHFGDKLGLYNEVLRYGACAAGMPPLSIPFCRAARPKPSCAPSCSACSSRCYGEDRPAWPVRLMTHELAQPTPAFDGVVEQIMRPKHDAIRALVGGVIGRPRTIARRGSARKALSGRSPPMRTAGKLSRDCGRICSSRPRPWTKSPRHIASFSYAALKSFARRNAAQNETKANCEVNMKNSH